jgi:hypothetical protein
VFAVFVGGITTLLLAIVVTIVLAVVWLAPLARDVASEQSRAPGAGVVVVPEPPALPAEPALRALSGLLCMTAGGYVAAWIARRAEVWHGALAAWPSVALGLAALGGGTASKTAWSDVAAWVLAPVVGAFGGYLRRRRAGGTVG